jgi:hypothetical protein
MTYIERNFNAETGETIEREYSKKEIDAVEAEQASNAVEIDAAKAKEAAKAAIAERLGLSPQELKTLLG